MNFNDYAKSKINEIKLKQIEHDSLTTMINKYGSEMDKKYQEILIVNGIDPNFRPKHAESCNCAQEKDAAVPVIIDEYKNINATLFKNLALVSHPDKTDSHTDDFLLIRAAYENNDVFTLLEYALKYDIEKGDICDGTMMMILERKMNNIINKIDKIKTLLGYHLLIHGHVDSHVANLKQIIRLEKENQEYAERNKRLEELLKNK